MVFELARKFAEKREVMILAVNGLEMEISDVRRCLTKNRDDISMAMHDVLSEWNSSYQNKKTAYKELCKALDDVKMSSLIIEALDGN